jgi:hypothetical protein
VPEQHGPRALARPAVTSSLYPLQLSPIQTWRFVALGAPAKGLSAPPAPDRGFTPLVPELASLALFAAPSAVLPLCSPARVFCLPVIRFFAALILMFHPLITFLLYLHSLPFSTPPRSCSADGLLVPKNSDCNDHIRAVTVVSCSLHPQTPRSNLFSRVCFLFS